MKSTKKVRRRACKYAAMVLSNRPVGEPPMPLCFSLAVFFEAYMLRGANAVAKDFGPKKPAKLRIVDADKPRRS